MVISEHLRNDPNDLKLKFCVYCEFLQQKHTFYIYINVGVVEMRNDTNSEIVILFISLWVERKALEASQRQSGRS